ncbi:hypothetical protein CEXT_645241 [Caerostris extrusa]|uniref:Uncharacterized protein n=1 Tax=Caerostris extrusa TaxID=172846 RepID=A0AAV4WNC7_CAEEX|nr:hypothetical protein CEXT_645241 [Caerostris extrusa]
MLSKLLYLSDQLLFRKRASYWFVHEQLIIRLSSHLTQNKLSIKRLKIIKSSNRADLSLNKNYPSTQSIHTNWLETEQTTKQTKELSTERRNPSPVHTDGY